MRRQILSRGLLTVAAASSILAVTGGIASADSDAGTPNTPGHSAEDQAAAAQDDSASGTSSSGSTSSDTAASSGRTSPGTAAADATGSGATAESDAEGSPGILSGNSVSVPIDLPVNVCGDSVDVGSLLNPAFGSHCANDEAPAPVSTTPQQQDTPPAPPAKTPQTSTPEVHTQLAETGASGGAVGAAAGAGAVMLLGGAMLYRRSTRAARVRRTNA